ncbi:MAG: bacterioferritin [bacterium]
MDKKKIIDILNADRADELAAIIQYMGHHYEADGIDSPAIIEKFKDTAKDEMRHAEMLGERINYLGGEPTKKPSEIKKGGEIKKMIQDDLDGENKAIKNYKEHIKIAAAEGDSTTRLMLEEILSDEEGHADLWETTLGIKK